jgi:hypothetical protein
MNFKICIHGWGSKAVCFLYADPSPEDDRDALQLLLLSHMRVFW